MSDDRYGARQIEILSEIHGPFSGPVASRLSRSLALALQDGDWPSVADLSRNLLEVQRHLVPEGDSTTLAAARALADAQTLRGEVAQARVARQLALQVGRRLGEPPGAIAADLLEMARLLQADGETARARALHAEAGDLLRDQPLPPTGLPARFQLLGLELAAAAGDGEAALAYLAGCRGLLARGPMPGAHGLVDALLQLARQLSSTENLELARRTVEAAIELARPLATAPAPLGDQGAATARALSLLGDLARKAGDLAGAKVAWEEALQLEQARGPEPSQESAVLLNNLGALCWDLGLHGEGYELVRQANKGFSELHGFLHPHTRASGQGLIQMREWLEQQKGAR